MDGWTDGRMDGWIGWMDRRMCKPISTDRVSVCTDRQIGRQTDRQADRQADRQTGRQTD